MTKLNLYNNLNVKIPARRALVRRKNDMGFPRLSQEKLLYILVNRTVIFLFAMCLLTLSLYTAGTIQGFTDSTQFSLLRLYESLGIFLMITSVFGIVLDIERAFKTKKSRYIFRAGGYLLLVIFSVATVLAVMAILTLAKGSGTG